MKLSSVALSELPVPMLATYLRIAGAAEGLDACRLERGIHTDAHRRRPLLHRLRTERGGAGQRSECTRCGCSGDGRRETCAREASRVPDTTISRGGKRTTGSTHCTTVSLRLRVQPALHLALKQRETATKTETGPVKLRELEVLLPAACLLERFHCVRCTSVHCCRHLRISRA